MKFYLLGLAIAISTFIFSGCAPVQFSKSETLAVGSDVVVNKNGVSCDPKISPNLTTFTYSTDLLPSINSNCDTSDLTYEWVLKKSDSSVVSTSIANLSGANPKDIDLRTLGVGTYYLYLTARDSNGKKAAYTTKNPLEFVVPSPNIGNSLTCDPKLNGNMTSVSLNSADSNPTVTANCNEAASMYIWTVKKNNSDITIAGLSGSSSTPDFKSYGVGTYKISLYATSTGSAHWQSSTPLVVVVNEPTMTELIPINCNPKINGTVTSITLMSTSSKPLISANCSPSDVSYYWVVKKAGETVTVGDLKDANSNPDFLALGSGTYLIYLTANKTNYKTWNTTTPMQITVDNSGTNTLTVNCSPRLSTDSVALTIKEGTANPMVSSNCNPSTATHEWTVYKNGSPVVINGLSGATSTPDFLSAGLGTYYIYLTAKMNGYNTYVIPSPLELTVSQSDYRRVTLTKNVQVTDNKVDILLVVDDSNSMLPDNRKLGEKLQNFVASLTSSGIDWNMCATVTRAQDVSGNGVYYWGASRNWVSYVGSPKWILKSGAADPYSIFTKTIEAIGAGWAGTDDERAIKAAFWHAEYAEYNTCYRTDAALAVILISDEDERSVGGDSSYVFYPGELQQLEADDMPHNYVNKIKQKFGMDKRFTVNSIIVKPNDATCMAAQDADGSKSHYGFKYAELSNLTNGFAGSICDTDYSQNLKYFKERIVSSLASIPLECTPVGNVDVKLTPSMSNVSVHVENNSLIFTPAIPAGYKIDLGYNCSNN